MKIVIVGGVAGGASAAARARRLSDSAEIVVIERNPDVSFANCGMPYFIGGEIVDRTRLIVTTADLLRSRFNLDVRPQSSAERIDPVTKQIVIRDLTTGKDYREPYDKLILAPGAAPFRPGIPGIDLPGIFTLRNLQDMDNIKATIDGGAKQAVVVGAGFIGLEMVENLVKQGLTTTLVELQDQILPPLDPEMTTPLVERLAANGVSLYTGQSAEKFEGCADGIVVHLNSGVTVTAHLVVLGIGVRPETTLAAAAGLEIGERGGIRVNEHLQTSNEDIYAVGDVIEVNDFTLGTATHIPLAGPANRQGRIAADHIFGRPSRYRGTQGTAVLGLFGGVAAATGVSEKILMKDQRSYRAVYVHPADHAGYYPGAEQMTLKLLFDPESGQILGAQGVGGNGVEKRIDVLATAIQAEMSVYDLEELELCYAPQFGSAKDPVNMLGFVAAGLMRGDHPQIDVSSLLAITTSDPPLVLDVRTHEEYNAGHISDSVLIPVDELRSRLDELPPDKEIITYCQVGFRGYLATRILLQAGYSVRNLSGGYKTYCATCTSGL